MKFEIYRQGRSGPRLGLTVSIVGRGEIDLPYLSDKAAFEQLTVPISKQQLAALVDHGEEPPPELTGEIISKITWWLQIQTEVLYNQWPRDTLSLLKSAYTTLQTKEAIT